MLWKGHLQRHRLLLAATVDLQDLKAYAEQLDDEIKYAMLSIITNTQ